MITLGKRGDPHRRSTSLACCRLCDRLLNLQRLRLLKRFCRSRDLAIAIQGPAGAGKTTFAAEAVRAIEALFGKDVMGLAPSSSAVNELRSRVTPTIQTIQQFMINPELQDAARGGVLRIDEASFLSARAGRWLLEFARDSGTRLVVRPHLGRVLRNGPSSKCATLPSIRMLLTPSKSFPISPSRPHARRSLATRSLSSRSLAPPRGLYSNCSINAL